MNLLSNSRILHGRKRQCQTDVGVAGLFVLTKGAVFNVTVCKVYPRPMEPACERWLAMKEAIRVASAEVMDAYVIV